MNSESNSTSPKQPPTAAFDLYANSYDGGIDNPLKKCVGGDALSFIEVKVDWLLARLARELRPPEPGAAVRLLDYGCGVSTFLHVLRRRAFSGDLAGCDVSQEMLNEGRKRWNQGPLPDLAWMEGLSAPFADGAFDVIVVSAVLHHIAPEDRGRTYADLLRLLRRGGRIYVFEHNPFNPLTQWVVRHSPIDENAVLLRPSEVRLGLGRAGASAVRTDYIMFTPPRLRFLRPIDKALAWLPLGGQYVVSAGA